MNKRITLIISCLLLFIGTAAYSFQQPPLVFIAPALPSTIYINGATTVKITARIQDARVLSDSVNLIQVNPMSGAQTIIGELHDDGLNGDTTAGDRTFTIIFNPSATVPTLFTYEVSAAFRGLLKRSLSGFITVAVVPSGIILPPDPGPSGMETLAGIDSDSDGVRDDVQRWIATTAFNSARERAALTQAALGMEAFLLDAQNRTLAIQQSNAMKAASDCLSYSQPNNYGLILTELESQVVNTALRSSAYIQANRQLGGQFYALPGSDKERIASCIIDPSSLLN